MPRVGAWPATHLHAHDAALNISVLLLTGGNRYVCLKCNGRLRKGYLVRRRDRRIFEFHLSFRSFYPGLLGLLDFLAFLTVQMRTRLSSCGACTVGVRPTAACSHV